MMAGGNGEAPGLARTRRVMRVMLVVLTIASGFGLILKPHLATAAPVVVTRCEAKFASIAVPPPESATTKPMMRRADDDERFDVPPSSLIHKDLPRTTERIDHAVPRTRPRLTIEANLWFAVLVSVGLALVAATLAADRRIGALTVPVLPPATGPPLFRLIPEV